MHPPRTRTQTHTQTRTFFEDEPGEGREHGPDGPHPRGMIQHEPDQPLIRRRRKIDGQAQRPQRPRQPQELQGALDGGDVDVDEAQRQAQAGGAHRVQRVVGARERRRDRGVGRHHGRGRARHERGGGGHQARAVQHHLAHVGRVHRPRAVHPLVPHNRVVAGAAAGAGAVAQRAADEAPAAGCSWSPCGPRSGRCWACGPAEGRAGGAEAPRRRRQWWWCWELVPAPGRGGPALAGGRGVGRAGRGG